MKRNRESDPRMRKLIESEKKESEKEKDFKVLGLLFCKEWQVFSDWYRSINDREDKPSNRQRETKRDKTKRDKTKRDKTKRDKDRGETKERDGDDSFYLFRLRRRNRISSNLE